MGGQMMMTLWLPHRLSDDTLQATSAPSEAPAALPVFAGTESTLDQWLADTVAGAQGGASDPGNAQQRAQGIDRWLAGVLVAEWLLGLIVLCYVSPHTALAKSLTHGAVGHWAPGVFLDVTVLHLVLVAVGAVMAWLSPGVSATRYTLTVVQALSVGILNQLCGGQFGAPWLGLCALVVLFAYRDWKLLLTATLIMLGDLTCRTLLWPASVYGPHLVTLGQQAWPWLERAIGLLVTYVALSVNSLQSTVPGGQTAAPAIRGALPALRVLDQSQDLALALPVDTDRLVPPAAKPVPHP
jgi:hypothetical protein